MKKTGIVTDSHSSMKPEEAEALGVHASAYAFLFG